MKVFTSVPNPVVNIELTLQEACILREMAASSNVTTVFREGELNTETTRNEVSRFIHSIYDTLKKVTENS